MGGGAWREFLFGLRQYRRSPGLAAGVALTIGLGVGANLAIVAPGKNGSIDAWALNATHLVVETIGFFGQ